MKLRIQDTRLPGVFLIEPPVYRDSRGWFLESYHRSKYEDLGISISFVQDNVSHSKQNVLRGLHYQLKNPQAKLVSVTSGQIFDVAVDIRQKSATFGKWVGIELSAENQRQLLIPEGYAHGFCVLSEDATVLYKCGSFYDPQDDRGILWSDPDLGIEWPLQDPILSEKDRGLPTLQRAREENLLP